MVIGGPPRSYPSAGRAGTEGEGGEVMWSVRTAGSMEPFNGRGIGQSSRIVDHDRASINRTSTNSANRHVAMIGTYGETIPVEGFMDR